MKHDKFRLSYRSLTKLLTCNDKLFKLVTLALRDSNEDFSVIDGYRPRRRQDAAYRAGNSQLEYPKSKHNVKKGSKPNSSAVDLAPYPLDWIDIEAFKRLANTIKIASIKYHIPIIWGGDWKSFKDYAHFELEEDNED